MFHVQCIHSLALHMVSLCLCPVVEWGGAVVDTEVCVLLMCGSNCKLLTSVRVFCDGSCTCVQFS